MLGFGNALFYINNKNNLHSIWIFYVGFDANDSIFIIYISLCHCHYHDNMLIVLLMLSWIKHIKHSIIVSISCIQAIKVAMKSLWSQERLFYNLNFVFIVKDSPHSLHIIPSLMTIYITCNQRRVPTCGCTEYWLLLPEKDSNLCR